MGVIYGLSLAVLALIAVGGAFAAKFRIAPLALERVGILARVVTSITAAGLLSLNPPTGLWDRWLGPGGRWAGACVRAGAFWGVQDWGAGLVRLVAGGVGLRCAGRSAAGQMSWPFAYSWD